MGDGSDNEKGNKFSSINYSSFKPQPLLNQKFKNADVYYGIFTADNLKKQEDLKLIFTDRTECLGILKRIPGARFKVFSSLIEAEKFVEHGPVTCYPTTDNPNEEKSFPLIGERPSPFSGPKSQDLVKFRKAIEKGNVNYFEECVTKNPRYLVSSVDTPSILQEGSRYNALHIACRNDQPYMCQRVLTIVSNVDFFQKLYPDDSIESSVRRSHFLLDLYLNTPDKAMNETPLHFACKLCSSGCVKVLVSYVGCDKNRINKHNEKPIEIIGNRVQSPNKNIVKQITDLLGDLYYIPLFRAEDNCHSPHIGSPCSPVHNSLSNDSPIGLPASSSSPISPSLKVSCYAGPMSPQRAETFYSRWKRSIIYSPVRNMQDKLSCIRITDHEKGLERVGRDLASEFSVDWLEYWDFLGSFTKLDSEDGLKKLEKHLQDKYKKISMDRIYNDETKKGDYISKKGKPNASEEFDISDSFSLMDSSINQLDQTQFSSTSIGEICRGLEALRLNMSLSPNPKINSFHNDVTFKETSKDSFQDDSYLHNYLNSNSINESLNTATMDGYNFVIQSISISSEKLLNILREAADSLELHVGQTFNVTFLLKTKIKKEIGNLRKVIISHLKSSKQKYDLSFVHILLAANISILLPESVTCDKIHLLLITINALQKNIKLFEASSSEEEDSFRETNCDIDSTMQLECFVKAFAKSLTIVNSLVKKGVESKLDKADLGVCDCGWNPVGGGTIKLTSSDNVNNLSASSANGNYKYSHAHSFLNKILFFEKFEKKSVTKQLIFNDEANLNHLSSSEAHDESHSSEDDDDAESFVSAVSSVDEAGMVTPEEAINVYINGVEPSKVDVDVLLAIDENEIDQEKFPYTSMWQKLVSSHSKKERESWTSPCCSRKLVSASYNTNTGFSFTPRHSRNNNFGNLGQSPIL